MAALAAAALAAPAAGAVEQVEPANTAIVEVATPTLPKGLNAPGSGPWRSARARAGEVLAGVAERNRLDVLGRIPETGQLTVELGPGGFDALRTELADDPSVVSVQRDREIDLRYAPNDTTFNLADPHAPGGSFYQWNLRNIGAPVAWDISKGANAEVAVIDSGTDVGHPDLAPRIAATYDCDPGPCAGTGVSDTAGHGTHVAGLACADTDNGYALASAGFDCRLSILKITTCSGAASAIVVAANRGADAINMSFGDCGSSLSSPVVYAYGTGAVPVAAGANEPDPGVDYPSSAIQSPQATPTLDTGRGLVVTAVKFDGNRASIAERTRAISVAAPGFATEAIGGQQGILSTWPARQTTADTGTFPIVPPCNCRTSLFGDNRFAYLVGTSMSTPQVSGVVALMRSVAPAITAPRLIKLVKQTASHCGSYVNGTGWGTVNAFRAVAAAEGRDIDAPASSLKSTKKRKRVLKISSADEGGSVSCADEIPTSGVDVVRIFSSRNGKRFRLIEKTKEEKFRFKPKRAGRYRLYSVAVDKAGNEEAAPAEADEKLKVKKKKKAKRKRRKR